MAPNLNKHPHLPILSGRILQLITPADKEGDGALNHLLNSQPSLPMILDAFSTWIARQIPHRILGYWNTRQRHLHLVVPDPSFQRENYIHAAQEVFLNPLPRTRFWRKNELIHHLWLGYPLDRFDHLLLIQNRQSLSIDKVNILLRQALPALNQAIHPGDDEASQRISNKTLIASS